MGVKVSGYIGFIEYFEREQFWALSEAGVVIMDYPR